MVLDVVPCPLLGAFVWRLDANDLDGYIRSESAKILAMLDRWQFSEAIFRLPDGQEISLTRSLLQEMGEQPQEQPQRLLWFANGVPITPALWRVAGELMENPRRAGICRFDCGRQVIMSDGCSILNPGHTLAEATQWARDQFWHPDDLDSFKRLARESGQQPFELRWRSFDPSLGPGSQQEGNWMEFSTRYEMFQDELGAAFHLCSNLGFRLIDPVLR